MSSNSLQLFFHDYIQGTAEKSLVPIAKIPLCSLTKRVGEVFRFHHRMTIYISTRALKHLYDKKPTEEFECILLAMDKIIRYPVRIYQNKSSKRGNYCFLGIYKRIEYVCSIEFVDGEGQIVTCFRKRDEKYLNEYILLWSRENDVPPS